MSKLQLGVFFGSRSCEREVSIISALQMMNHVDTEKYDVVPVYIDQDGAWYTGPALRELRTFAPFHADAKGVENVNLEKVISYCLGGETHSFMDGYDRE